MFFDVFVYFAVLTRGREQHNFPILNGIPKTSRGGRGMSFLHVGSCIAWPGSFRPHATTVKESMGAGSDNFHPRAATQVAPVSLTASAAAPDTPKNGSHGSFYTPKG